MEALTLKEVQIFLMGILGGIAFTLIYWLRYMIQEIRRMENEKRENRARNTKE